MPDEKTTIVNEERDTLVNQKFQAFIADLVATTNASPMGACCVICWSEESRVSIAVTIPAHVPQKLQLRICDLLAKKFSQAVLALKLRINTVRQPGN